MTGKAQNKADNAISVGIDLGTSRSVVTANTGEKYWVESYVGWPKDFIARKTLGKDVLFGKEVLDHRLSVEMCRPLANGVIKDGTKRDEESVRELIGHLLQSVNGGNGGKIRAAVGVPARALKVNRDAIRDAVSQYAGQLILVSEPFAVAYGQNALDNAMVIDIGAGTVDFCIMHGTMPDEEDQRTLVTAGDYIDSQLRELLQERHAEADWPLSMVRRIKEQHSFVGTPTHRVTVEVPVHGHAEKLDVTDEVRRACESIMPSIAETIMEMIATFDPEFQAAVRENIILAGGGSQIRGIREYLTQATKDLAPCTFHCVEDALYAGARGALGLSADMPEAYWAKM